MMWWAEPVPDMGERRNAYRMLLGKLVGKENLGRPRCRLDDHIKTVLMEMRRDGCWSDSSDSGQRQVTGCCEHGNELSGFPTMCGIS
jgi:hypothetical protein